MEEALSQAQQGIGNVKSLPRPIGDIGSVVDALPVVTAAVKSFADTWSSLLDKLEIFTQITDQLAEIHPYVKTACFILSGVPKIIIAQRSRDASLCSLMETIEDIHSFVLEAEPLKIVDSHQKTLEDMSRLTVECAYLIRDYTVNRNFWKRIATLTLAGVEAKMQQYDTTFKELKAAFQGRAIARIEIAVFRSLAQVEDTAKNIVLHDMPYAKGAGYDSDKVCLPDTRTFALNEIDQWINLPDGDDAPRLRVMTGVASCGKSTIAHTVARHYATMERLGSAVFFERADQSQRNSGNLLSTVARDIANLDADWRQALYDIVKDNDALRHTQSISRQMESFILEPAKALKTIGPIVIVIDALDESGDVSARSGLLRSLAANVSALPRNFRILITARAERDILEAFLDIQSVTVAELEALTVSESAVILQTKKHKYPADRRRTYPIRMEGAMYRMEAGYAHGISAGAEFAIYADESAVLTSSALGILAVDRVDIFQTTMKITSCSDSFAASNSAVALQTKAGDRGDFSMHVEVDDKFMSIFEALLTEMQGNGPGRAKITLVEKEQAKLEVVMQGGLLYFDILDKRVAAFYDGIMRIPFPVDPEPHAIRPVLRSIAHYYWHLDRESEYDSYFRSHISVEFFELQESSTELDDAGYFVLEPGPRQLCNINVIDFTVNPNAEYGMKITNSTPWDLYPGVFYFETGDLSIVPYYLISNSGESAVDSPLKRNGGTLTIGYGSTGTSPRAYAFRDGQESDVDIGFLKIFLATKYVDLSDIPQTTPFNSGRADFTKKKRNIERWGSTLIPLVQRRH
ncbi:hypothetical protein FIBSPDRAFT_212881 [Athelia psychrophila]|uniref:Nephrocystin 3-like N-terminal domain-containing protein n=1 Tax=Athelia psychrophila TaxID=1759441 RepID=A0A166SAQ9_9AGAM|nr:hypothetical protein FIBSPDRAFT_212881 [Fibularhizoctonia sp. CBS 109695]